MLFLIDLTGDSPISKSDKAREKRELKQYWIFIKKMRKNFREGRHPPKEIFPWKYDL